MVVTAISADGAPLVPLFWPRRLALLLSLLLACASCGGGGGGGGSSVAAAPAIFHNYEALFRADTITATPTALTGSYAAGTVIDYSFVGKDPLATVLVKLDGNLVPASGKLTMDKAHLIEAIVDNRVGSRAPNFSGQTWDGTTVTLSELLARNKYVLLDFSELSCDGSLHEASYLKAHYADLKARGIEVVTVLVFGNTGSSNVNLTTATSADLRSWVTTFGLSYPVISDPANATLIYNINWTPTTKWSERGIGTDIFATNFPTGTIIGKDGIIIKRIFGFGVTEAEGIAIFDAALSPQALP